MRRLGERLANSVGGLVGEKIVLDVRARGQRGIRSSECAYLAASGRQINWELGMREPPERRQCVVRNS